MTRLNDLCYVSDPIFGSKFSCEVETNDAKVINYLGSKTGMNLLFTELLEEESILPKIKDVIFNDPATIVIWDDGSKTIVKANERYGDIFNPEMGLAMAICKKAYGNKGSFNSIFDKWIWNNERVRY